MSDPAPQAGELAATLRDLRAAAGLSGMEAAARANRSQSWISRYERGRLVPAPDDVELLARVYNAPPRVRRRLLALSRDLREDATPPARIVMRRGAGQMQQRIGRIEASSMRIATFQPALVPGLLQTEAYSRAVFASGGDMPPDQQAAAAGARRERQELLRSGGDREFVFVLTEGPLRWQLGGAHVMAEQLRHIAELSLLPRVRVGVIPQTVPVPVAPLHGFDLYDQRAATVGTETATAILTNPHDVATYVRLFTELEALAVYDDQAREVLASIKYHD